MHGGWLAQEMPIWMCMLEGQTRGSCCRGVGLQKKCAKEMSIWIDRLYCAVPRARYSLSVWREDNTSIGGTRIYPCIRTLDNVVAALCFRRKSWDMIYGNIFCAGTGVNKFCCPCLSFIIPGGLIKGSQF